MSLPQPLTLYGAPVGLYTGKIRSYLRKQGIAYVERLPSDPVFRKEVMPAIGRFINPVIRMPDGRIVQDTADIIDFLEAEGLAREASTPQSPLQRIVALTLDLFGGEGMIRPAMHYRWSYREQNEAFLKHEFGLSYRPSGAKPEVVEPQLRSFMNYLHAYIEKFGINQGTRDAVEASYEDFLAIADAHFRAHPYILGGKPTIADYGLMAPLYAHLARDPYPSNLMKLRAPSLYRWTERMNAADADMPEFPRYAQQLPEADEIPATLDPLLKYLATDFLPEAELTVRAVEEMLAGKSPEEYIGKPMERQPCAGTLKLRGVELKTALHPYLLYKLQRVTDAYETMGTADQDRVRARYTAAGLNRLLSLKAKVRVERRNHLEIWAART